MDTTKRKMIKATGIVAIVFGSLAALGGFFMVVFSWLIARVPQYHWNGFTLVPAGYWLNTGLMIFLIAFGLLILAAAITQIVLGSRIIRRSSDPEISTRTCHGALIAITIIAFLAVGGIILAVLALIALFMNDGQQVQTVDGQQVVMPNPGRGQQQVVNNTPGINNLAAMLARYKQYKEDGIITEAQYKQKVHEAVEKNLLSETTENK